MADEQQPTNWELGRRLDDIQRTLLTSVVGQPEYISDRRGTERRLDDVERDVEAIGKRIDSHEAAHQASGLHWRTLLWTGLLPAVATILAVLVTAYLTHGGR